MAVIIVPTRRNQNVTDFFQGSTSVREVVLFKSECGIRFAQIVVRRNSDGHYGFKYLSLNNGVDKFITNFEKRRPESTVYSSDEADKTFRLFQKRLKEVVSYKQLIPNKEVEVEIEIVEEAGVIKETPSTPYIPTTGGIIEEAKERTWKPKAKPKVGLEATIFDLVIEGVNSNETSDLIQTAVRKKLDELGVVPNQTHIVVQQPNKAPKNTGIQHKDFATILQMISAGVNIALVGAAGSGKTTTVKKVSEALDKKFYSQSVSAQTGSHEFFGYKNANGDYVRTLFREAYEFGGVFLLDEFDAGNPNVLAALNQATANGSCSFADGMIDKHEDFIVVMAGNTYGHGATSEYVGRNRIDAATLDRFVFLQFDYDEDFEYQLAENKSWCKIVQGLRAKARRKKIKTIISPRATFDGSKLLSVGMDIEMVKKVTIYKGLSEDEINLLK